MCSGLSIRACAFGASVSGKVESMIGATLRASRSGQTFSKRLAATVALNVTGRGRRVEPVWIRRFCMSLCTSGFAGRPVPSRQASYEEMDALVSVMGELKRGIMQITIGKEFSLDEMAKVSRERGVPVTWTALLSGFVLYPVYTGRGDAAVPVGIGALALILYTYFHPGVRRARQAEPDT